MFKVIIPNSEDFGVPVASLAEVHSGGIDSSWLTKRAAVLTKAIADVRSWMK